MHAQMGYAAVSTAHYGSDEQWTLYGEGSIGPGPDTRVDQIRESIVIPVMPDEDQVATHLATEVRVQSDDGRIVFVRTTVNLSFPIPHLICGEIMGVTFGG